jgi:energy-converting hydrogenase Eha subunit A
MNHAMSLRRLSMLTVLALLAACLTSVVVTALTGIPAARADTPTR